MQTVQLDSYYHYKTIERDGKIILLEYPDDACPGMGDREEFTEDEAEEIASWEPGEVVRFVLLEYTGTLDATDRVICGDDIKYEIQHVEE